MALSGILNLNKPPGWTSFQVVSLVRKGTGIRRVGHAGTLDPTATGVLVVCLGQAVRISEYIQELPKLYRAQIRLGTATDTYDSTGRPILSGDPSRVTEEQIRSALRELTGRIRQVPPSFSAIKLKGEPAYRLARRGEAVCLPPRTVEIYRIALLRFEPPVLELEVECGRGTYIRSLAHDLGQRLGCGAHLGELVRARVGPFRLEEALTVEALREALAGNTWQGLLLPLDRGLEHMPAVTLDREQESWVRHGRPIDAEAPTFASLGRGSQERLCRAYGEDGSLIAILTLDRRSGRWRPEKVFAPP